MNKMFTIDNIDRDTVYINAFYAVYMTAVKRQFDPDDHDDPTRFIKHKMFTLQIITIIMRPNRNAFHMI